MGCMVGLCYKADWVLGNELCIGLSSTRVCVSLLLYLLSVGLA